MDQEKIKARVQLLNPETGEVIGDCDLVTSVDYIFYSNEKKTIDDFRGIKAGTSFENMELDDLFDKLL